jgi:branched-subunit amino acid ABC-type transport system permease component
VVLAAALVGRVGSASGAFRGALAVGISTEVIAAFTDPALKQVYAFALLGVVMMVRRQGILRGLTEQTVVT